MVELALISAGTQVKVAAQPKEVITPTTERQFRAISLPKELVVMVITVHFRMILRGVQEVQAPSWRIIQETTIHLGDLVGKIK